MNFMDWINDNPQTTYTGLGLLKGLIDAPKQRAAAEVEILKSQYAPYLGQGDLSKARGKSPFDQALAGYFTGAAQDQKNKFSRAIEEALKGPVKPKYRKPAVIKTEETAVKPEIDLMRKPAGEIEVPEYEKITKPGRNYEIPSLLERPKTYNDATGYNNYQTDYKSQLDDFLMGRVNANGVFKTDPRNISQKVRDMDLSIKGGF